MGHWDGAFPPPQALKINFFSSLQPCPGCPRPFLADVEHLCCLGGSDGAQPLPSTPNPKQAERGGAAAALSSPGTAGTAGGVRAQPGSAPALGGLGSLWGSQAGQGILIPGNSQMVFKA